MFLSGSLGKIDDVGERTDLMIAVLEALYTINLTSG